MEWRAYDHAPWTVSCHSHSRRLRTHMLRAKGLRLVGGGVIATFGAIPRSVLSMFRYASPTGIAWSICEDVSNRFWTSHKA